MCRIRIAPRHSCEERLGAFISRRIRGGATEVVSGVLRCTEVY
jgi:hypothetical protein